MFQNMQLTWRLKAQFNKSIFLKNFGATALNESVISDHLN